MLLNTTSIHDYNGKRKRKNNTEHQVRKKWQSFEDDKMAEVSDFILDVENIKIHIVIQLTLMDYERVKKNCIILSGLTCWSEKEKEHKHMQHKNMYSHATIGKNIKLKKVITNDNIKNHIINLDDTKKNYACAIIDKKELLEC